MDSKGRLFQEIHVVNAMPSGHQAAYEDIFNGSPNTDVVNLGKYNKALWIIQKAAGDTGVARISVESCDDVTPSTATPVAFSYWTCTSGDTFSDMNEATSYGFTTTAGANQMYAIEINDCELSGTDQYARLATDETTDGACDGTITCIMGGPRFMHEVKPTAIV